MLKVTRPERKRRYVDGTANRKPRTMQETRDHHAGYRFRDAIQSYLTPIILIVLGTVLWSQWSGVQVSIAEQATAQQQIMVQLATIQEQIREGQQAYDSTENQISSLQATQRDHEHRLTVLEALGKGSTGVQFKPR